MNAVDTSIVIYACDNAAGDRQQHAQTLLRKLVDGVMLWQVACEFIAASRKLGSQGFVPELAWQQLHRLLRAFPLVTPSPGVLDRAHELHVHGRIAFWDAMIFAACIDAGVATLYSEDLPGRALENLQVINPFA